MAVATVRLLILVVWSLMVLLIGWGALLASGDSMKVSRCAARYWGKVCLYILNIQVRFSGTIPNEKSFIMSNHRSYVDIILIFSHTPAAIISKKEIARWPIIGQGMRLMRAILVDRKNLSSLIDTMHKVKVEIKNNGSVILFPEGATYGGPSAGRFKLGSFKIAAETKTPVVPVAIQYEDEQDAWVDGLSFLTHFFRQMGKWQTRVSIWYGNPIRSEDMRTLRAQVRNRINERLDAMQKKYTQDAVHGITETHSDLKGVETEAPDTKCEGGKSII